MTRGSLTAVHWLRRSEEWLDGLGYAQTADEWRSQSEAAGAASDHDPEPRA